MLEPPSGHRSLEISLHSTAKMWKILKRNSLVQNHKNKVLKDKADKMWEAFMVKILSNNENSQTREDGEGLGSDPY